MGTMQERRPKVWELRVEGGRDPATGRRTRLTRTVRGSRRDASRALAAFETEVAEQLAVTGRSAGTATFATLTADWWAIRSPDLSPSTTATYRSQLDTQILPALGLIPLRSLTAAPIDRLYRSLTDAGLSGSTVERYHAVIHAILARGVKWGWIDRNPADQATPPDAHPARTDVPDIATVRGILAAADAVTGAPWFGVAIRLAAATGARRGEICGLQWEDLSGSTLTIRRSIAAPGKTTIPKATKTHADRTVTIDTTTATRLEDWRTDLVADGFRCAATDYVLTGGPDPMHPARVTQLWTRRIQPGTGYQLRSLRNAQVTALLDAGHPIKSVQTRVGHGTTAITLDVYARAVASRDDGAADIIGEALDGNE